MADLYNQAGIVREVVHPYKLAKQAVALALYEEVTTPSGEVETS
jgi:hypothetical protein